MKVFDIDERIPNGTLSPKLTPELQARAETLAKDLWAAGISVAVTLDAGMGGDVPAWILGDAKRLTQRLRQAIGFLDGRPYDCEKCRQKRGQVKA